MARLKSCPFAQARYSFGELAFPTTEAVLFRKGPIAFGGRAFPRSKSCPFAQRFSSYRFLLIPGLNAILENCLDGGLLCLFFAI